MKEIWKDVQGYEADYMVSNLGRVCLTNLKRDILHILNLSLSESGYNHVSLRKNGKNKRFRVGRLAAITFVDTPENKPQVNHINGIKNDDRVENIEWCTPSENTIHAYKLGLAVSVKGVNKPFHKLSEDDVRQIRKSFLIGKCKKIRLAEKYNVSHPTIHRIISGEKWKHII